MFSTAKTHACKIGLTAALTSPYPWDFINIGAIGISSLNAIGMSIGTIYTGTIGGGTV
jgi:hypothetical protein